MPRRSRSMAPVRSSRSATRVVRRASCSAASSSARRLTPPSCSRSCFRRLDALFGLFQRRQFLAVLDLGALGQFVRARIPARRGCGCAVPRCGWRRFPTAPGRGRVPRARRTAPHRRPWRACRLRPARLRLRWRASTAWLRAASAVAMASSSALRLSAISSGTCSALASSPANSSWRRVSSAIWLCGGGLARFPARGVLARWRQAARAGLRLRGAGFPARRALRRLAVRASAVWPRASATSWLERHAVAQFLQRRLRRWRRDSSRRFHRLCPGGGFPLPEWPAARRARRRRGRRGWLWSCARDQCLFGGAFLLLRRRARLRARRWRRPWPRNSRQSMRRELPWPASTSCSRARQAIALRQPHGGRRGRIGRGDIAVPAPQIAARRDQPLAGLAAASAAPRPGRGRPGRSWPGGASARRAP